MNDLQRQINIYILRNAKRSAIIGVCLLILMPILILIFYSQGYLLIISILGLIYGLISLINGIRNFNPLLNKLFRTILNKPENVTLFRIATTYKLGANKNNPQPNHIINFILILMDKDGNAFTFIFGFSEKDEILKLIDLAKKNLKNIKFQVDTGALLLFNKTESSVVHNGSKELRLSDYSVDNLQLTKSPEKITPHTIAFYNARASLHLLYGAVLGTPAFIAWLIFIAFFVIDKDRVPLSIFFLTITLVHLIISTFRIVFDNGIKIVRRPDFTFTRLFVQFIISSVLGLANAVVVAKALGYYSLNNEALNQLVNSLIGIASIYVIIPWSIAAYLGTRFAIRSKSSKPRRIIHTFRILIFACGFAALFLTLIMNATNLIEHREIFPSIMAQFGQIFVFIISFMSIF